jgi:hypothetical protein
MYAVAAASSGEEEDADVVVVGTESEVLGGVVMVCKNVSTDGTSVCLTLSTSDLICVMVFCSVLGSCWDFVLGLGLAGCC